MKTVFFAIAAALLPFSAQSAEVEFHTTSGLLVFDIDEKNAPLTAKNFLQYVEDGFYDGLIFHRVIPNFVIQGGGFTKDMEQQPTRPPIKNEAANGLKNKKFSLSMARTSDPDSASSQFFINLNDNAALDPSSGNAGYAVFGDVIEGQDVVEQIAVTKTGANGHYKDVPVQPIVVTKAVVRE